MRISIEQLSSFPLSLIAWDIVFLYGDLGAGKTTLTKHLLARFGINPNEVRSPTYTYMQSYTWADASGKTIQLNHFDLYRVQDYETFLNIWGQEIIENTESIKLIEWPEIISDYVVPTKTIHILPTENEDEREFEILIPN